MRVNPHLVLDGAVARGREPSAPGRSWSRVGRRRDQRRTRASPPRSPSAPRAGSREQIELVSVPDRFVAGEESALVQWLNGGPAKPTFAPPRPYERGVARAPDARPERRDARQHRAHRPLRRRLVPRARHRRRARLDARHAGRRRRAPRHHRARVRHAAARRARRVAAAFDEPRRPCSSAATSAPGCRPPRRSTPRSRRPGCGRSARLSAPARSPCCRSASCGLVETARLAAYLAARERRPVRAVRLRAARDRRRARLASRPATPMRRGRARAPRGGSRRRSRAAARARIRTARRGSSRARSPSSPTRSRITSRADCTARSFEPRAADPAAAGGVAMSRPTTPPARQPDPLRRLRPLRRAAARADLARRVGLPDHRRRPGAARPAARGAPRRLAMPAARARCSSSGAARRRLTRRRQRRR